ncbi:hypothetical protein BTW08_15205 [Salinicola sp. MH3R3-1]|uniref:hypothetical protein n=1 Tax=Salinicola sp. MH3R3-1 TaxID=1928762 RepID=UPI00094E86E9|nr:hypothetical protein [Salinicola sp. MH3R3-1]OLO06842.1 hypothetical protein BTW08_15205 [Salinicola sp. MH3R3-1]
MATNSYFEGVLSESDEVDEPSKGELALDLFVSNYSGKHELYLKATDNNGNVSEVILTQEQAMELQNALERANSYLGYDKP